MAYQLAGPSPDLNAQVDQLAQMALQSGDHLGFFQRYLMLPTANRLAAQLAQGVVNQQVQGVQTQQALQQYNPQQPTVLDQLQQQQMQGLAAMPIAEGMFHPSVYTQGGIGAGLGDEEPQDQAQMARGGIVAFAGEGPSLVSADEPVTWGRLNPGSPLTQAELDAIAAERLRAERYKPSFPGEGFGTAETPEAKAVRDARIAEAQKRAAARLDAEGRPAASEASRPAPAAPAEPPPAPTKNELKAAERIKEVDDRIERTVNKGKDPSKLIAERAKLVEGINAGRSAPTVAPSGIAAPGPTAGPTVEAVTPKPIGAVPAGGAGAGVPPAGGAGGAGVPPAGGAGGAEVPPAGRAGAIRSGLGSLGRIMKWGVGAPLAAELGWLGGQYIGNQINEHTGVQEGIRNLLDRFGLASPSEDRANASMQPGYMVDQLRDRQAVKSGVEPLILTAANAVAKEETSNPFLTPSALGAVNPENTSFGATQLHIKGGLPSFVGKYGKQFGLTAAMGTPEFAKQWKAAAKNNPTEFGKAQLESFQTDYLNPTRTQLSSLLSGTVDPRVLTYFASRAVQYGPNSTANDKQIITDLYNSADGDVVKFLEKMSTYDIQNYERRFRSEAKKSDTDKNKYDYFANVRRINQRRDNALGTTPMERLRTDAGAAVDTAREIADVVGQQPAVQAATDLLGRGLGAASQKGADFLEKVFPLNTGFAQPKPTDKPNVYDQYADLQKRLPPAEAAPAAPKEDRLLGMDRERLRNLLLHTGAGLLAGTSPYAGVNLGKALMLGLDADQKHQLKLEERAAKMEENEKTRAEKQYEARVKAASASLKQTFPDFEKSGVDIDALANYAALKGMAPRARKVAGYDDETFKEMERTAQKLMGKMSDITKGSQGSAGVPQDIKDIQKRYQLGAG